MNVVNPNRAGSIIPRQCSRCSSWAVNPGWHGRGKDRLDLCDVCYWRAKHEELCEAVAWGRETSRFDPWRALVRVYELHGEDYTDAVYDDFLAIRHAARAEVDRLIAEEGAK